MRKRSPIIQIIAGGAIVLPLLAFGHGSEFLDAKFFFDERGKANLEITADYAGNPMITSEAEACTALADALRVSFDGHDHQLADLAPLKIEPRAKPDPESPTPRGPEDASTPHQLLTAVWQWEPFAETMRFFVPMGSQHTVLFWMREPDVHPPRWSMLIAADRTPLIQVPQQPQQRWWLALITIPIGVLVWWRRSSNHSRTATE
jgi:hypothetical protein